MNVRMWWKQWIGVGSAAGYDIICAATGAMDCPELCMAVAHNTQHATHIPCIMHAGFFISPKDMAVRWLAPLQYLSAVRCAV